MFLTNGLNRFFGLVEKSEIALVGHSHLMLSIDHQGIEKATGKKVAKYTRAGVNVADRSAMIEHLLDKCPDLNLVIYGVDAWMFTGEGLSQNSHTLFYPFMSNAEIDQYIYSKASTKDYWQRKIFHTTRYDERLVSAAFRGYIGNWNNHLYGQIDTTRVREEIRSGKLRDINSSPENKEIFETTLRKLVDEGVKVLLIYTPTVDIYNDAEPEKFQAELDYFRTVAKSDTSINLIEYLDPWSSDYSMFFDPIHLNPTGQKEITDSLSIYIRNTYLSSIKNE